MLVKEYFKDQQDKLVCGCGCGLRAPGKAVEMLYAVRIILGYPIIVKSSIRCKKHNKAEGGSKLSMHLPWYERNGYENECAFDITVIDKKTHKMLEWRLIQICQFVGFGGIGFKDNTFLHIDNRKVSASVVWGYPK